MAKIIKQEKNPFLEREELVLEIQSDSTPTSDEVKKEILAARGIPSEKGTDVPSLSGKDAELTVIKKINTSFGKRIFTVEAVVYDNAEAKKKIETIPQKVRKKMEADKKAEIESARKAEEEAKKTEEEAKAAVEAPEETPVEEPKIEEKAE